MSKLVSLIVLVQIVKDGTVAPAIYQTFELWVLLESDSFCVCKSQIVHNVFTHFFPTFN